MPIKIKTADEFERLIEGLGSDIVTASVHLSLYENLCSAVSEYEREMKQSETFWSLTVRAHGEIALYSLCRVYDREPSSLSLGSFLETVRDNLELFDEDRFRERLAENPFVNSLAASARRPDEERLQMDLNYSSPKNPVVKKLVRLRGSTFAHRGSRLTAMGKSMLESSPMLLGEVRELAEGALEIFNTYKGLFHAQSQSVKMIGADDFRGVLEAVRRDLEVYDEEFE